MRLDIAVYGPLFMGIIERLAEGFEQRHSKGKPRRPPLAQYGVERAPLDKLHGNIVLPLFLTHIIHCDNGRVAQAGR